METCSLCSLKLNNYPKRTWYLLNKHQQTSLHEKGGWEFQLILDKIFRKIQLDKFWWKNIWKQGKINYFACTIDNKLTFHNHIMSFHQNKNRDWNLSGIKLYISFAISWENWIETTKYWKSWWYPFCTHFNLPHLIFL